MKQGIQSRKTDWLGREYGPGDLILYTKGYGASGSQMVLAEVKEIKETTVIARILKGSRGPRQPSMRYIDLRTGRGINPWCPKHIKKKAHYILKSTGEELSNDERYKRNPLYGVAPNVPYYLHTDLDTEYVRDEYWDYVGEGPGYTTFYITDNIVKVDRNTVDLGE